MSEKVLRFLDEKKIEYVLHTHVPVYTVEDAKLTREFIQGLHLKNLFTVDSKSGIYYLLTAPADAQIHLNSIRKEIGARKLTLASPEELMEQLGVEPGSVSFLNLLSSKGNVTLIVHKEIFEAERVTYHPNDNSITLEISISDFKLLLEMLAPNYLVI